MFGTPLSDELDGAVRDIVYPVDPPEETVREIQFQEWTITIRRRADTIVFEVPSNPDADEPEDTAEHQLRMAFGLDAETKEAEGRKTVFGFKTVVDGGTTRMRIGRAPLIAEIV